MRTARDLRESWERNEDLKDAWRKVTESPEWNAVSSLVLAEAQQAALTTLRGDADPILARNLMRLDGAVSAIETLQSIWRKPEPLPTLPEDYDDDYIKKLQERKLAEQQ
jgi:hypothetical protein